MADDVEFGHVVDLTLGEPAGTELVADAAIGATSLLVDYAGDFEDTGEVVLNGEVIAYTAITYGDLETDPDTIALTAPLAAAALTDDRVGIVSGGEPVVDWALHVSLGDGHPVEIPIPFEQRAMWSTVDVSTPVPVFVSADLERLVEVPGRTPVIDGASVDASTLDVTNLGGATKPSASPTLTVTGFAEGLIVRATDVAPGVLIEYHISDTPGFTPDATTLSADTRATVYVLTRLPDGSAPDLATTYYLQAVAHNGAGEASSSPEVTGRLDPTAVSALIVSELVAGFILAGRIQVGVAYIDADEGIVIPQPDGGVIHLPVDGSSATITAHIIARSLSVADATTIQGIAYMLGTLRLTNGIPDPATAPTVTAEWPELTTALATSEIAYQHHGLCDTQDGTKWVTVRRDAIVFLNKSDGALASTVALPSDVTAVFGVTRVIAYFYVLVATSSDPTLRVQKYDMAGASVADWDSGVNDDPALSWPTIGKTYGGIERPLVASFSDSVAPLDVVLSELDTTSGAIVAGVNLDYGSVTPLASVGRGDFDLGGGSDRVLAAPTMGDVRCFGWLTGDPDATNDFPRAANANQRGMWWDGTRFWTLDDNGIIRKHYPSPTALTSQNFGYTYRDDNATGGTHETGLSPVKVASTLPKRACPKVTTPPAPEIGGAGTDIADRVRVYAGAVGALKLQGSTLAANVRTVTLDPITTSGTAPPANNFTGVGGLGKVEATTGGFTVDGKSNGSVGTGTFLDSVRAAVIGNYAAGAWTAYTPTFTASVTNPTLGNFTISGRYSQRGKTVNFVALITCDTAAGMGSGNYQFGLPVAARATNEVVCIAQQSGPNHGYQGRGASTTTINLFLTSTDAVATVTSTGMAAGTSIRISGTYEAA